MSKVFSNKKRDLFYKSTGLRKLSFATSNSDKLNEIRKEQDYYYKKLKFIENLEKALINSDSCIK